jgi:hypothetical protein
MIRGKDSSFTLVEVVVALAILAMGLIGILSLTASASNRTAKALKKWETAHRLAQGAEFFLLAGPKENIPDEVFPYKDSSISCSVESPSGLPAEVQDKNGNWKLVSLKITLSSEGNIEDSVSVEKMLKEEDL